MKLTPAEIGSALGILLNTHGAYSASEKAEMAATIADALSAQELSHSGDNQEVETSHKDDNPRCVCFPKAKNFNEHGVTCLRNQIAELELQNEQYEAACKQFEQTVEGLEQENAELKSINILALRYLRHWRDHGFSPWHYNTVKEWLAELERGSR